MKTELERSLNRPKRKGSGRKGNVPRADLSAHSKTGSATLVPRFVLKRRTINDVS